MMMIARALPLLSVLALGCVEPTTEALDVTRDDAPPTVGAPIDDPTPAVGLPSRGRHVPGWATLEVEPWVEPGDGGPRAARPLEARSRAELADALRPVLATSAGVFVARRPNWAAADTILREPDEGMDDAGDPPLPPAANARIFGTDDRRPVSSPPAPVYRPIALVDGLDDITAFCTGAYIGPWTFVMSASCLTEGGRMTSFIGFQTEMYLSPWGSENNCSNRDADPTNDFTAAIPAGYLPSRDPALDFAVIDTYPCHRAPHWFGEPAANQGILANAGTTTYSMYGYSSDCVGGDGRPCGMSGLGYANGPFLESQVIDTELTQPGFFRMQDRGAPWFVAGRVAGVYSGYREYFDFFRCGFDVCRRNFARRFDATFVSFLNAVAYDYP